MSFHGDGTRSNRYLLRPCSEFRLADHEFVSCYTPLREVSMVTFEKLFSPRFLMSRVLWYTGAGRFCVIERSGYKLRVFPTALSTALWLDRSERTDDERFLQTYLDSGDTFLDIGANIGTHALAAASRVGPAGRVLAFEPHPKTFGFLRQNIAFNGFRNIETFCLGLGDVGGVYRFADDKCDDQNGVLESNDQAITKAIDVQIACLDDFSFPRLDLVKIDAEGYELPIMRGGRETLRRVKCVFYESWEQAFCPSRKQLSGDPGTPRKPRVPTLSD